MKTNKENDVVEIFAGSLMEAEIVKSLLEDSEIEVFLKDELMGALAPWHTSSGGMASVKVVISKMNYAKAKLVIDNFKLVNTSRARSDNV